MKVLSNRAFAKRGESFTLKFGQTDNIPPLVLTERLQHPFITLKIVSTVYPQTSRYEMTRWLDCQNVIRFKEAKIMHLGEGTVADIVIPETDTSYCTRVYSVLENGKLVYFYIDASGRKEYNFNFKVTFDIDETKKMVDNEYIVNLFLVDGQSTKEVLQGICSKYNIIVDNIGDMFRALQNINAPELKTIDVNAPLNILSMNIPLYQFKLYMEEQ